MLVQVTALDSVYMSNKVHVFHWQTMTSERVSLRVVKATLNRAAASHCSGKKCRLQFDIGRTSDYVFHRLMWRHRDASRTPTMWSQAVRSGTQACGDVCPSSRPLVPLRRSAAESVGPVCTCPERLLNEQAAAKLLRMTEPLWLLNCRRSRLQGIEQHQRHIRFLENGINVESIKLFVVLHVELSILHGVTHIPHFVRRLGLWIKANRRSTQCGDYNGNILHRFI